MKQSRRRRRKPQSVKQDGDASAGDCNGGSEKEMIIKSLVEVFSLASIEEAKAAFDEANGDPNRAAEILSGLSDNSEANQTSCSSSTQSYGLDSSSSEGFTDFNCANDDVFSRGFRKNKGKKVAAATGTVSTVLGKDYVSSSPRTEVMQQKGTGGGKVNVEEAEQFMCSMLGDDCELSMGVVRDVLCTCGYDLEKAFDVLLELSAPSHEQSRNKSCPGIDTSKGEYPNHIDFTDNFWQPADRGSDSNSHSSESDSQESARFFDINYRNYAEALLSSNSLSDPPAASSRNDGSKLPQQVLESLFNIPKSAEREPATMNWRNVVKQMESFAHKQFELGSSGTAGTQLNNLAKGAEYHVFREKARQQWDKMRTCYQKAATAYTNGEKNYASYMSDKGKSYSKMAKEADEKASMEIFKARNKDIENVLTIDLHGQHVKPAMRLVKLHLLFGTYISSVQYIRIITGCGSHGLGKSKLKESVINLVEKEGIEWREENRGTVIIRLDGPREFTFLDSGSDSDS